MSLYVLTWLFTIILLGILSWYILQVIVTTYEQDSVTRIQRFGAFLALWVIYLLVISSTGILNDFELPPKMPLFVVLPALALVSIVLTRDATGRVLDNTPSHLIVGFQSFRIFVELIIWKGYLSGFLPVETTFEGMNYDVIVGITAIPMAFYIYKERISNGLVLFWNIAGLLILANTVRVFITSGFFPEAFGLDPQSVGSEFVTPPYLFIAAIFMPLAVFLHFLSIKKITRKSS